MDSGKAKILVVDDDPVIRLIATETLEQNGFTVVEADNGEDALQIISATGCDLVLLDVVMPRLDGFATCRRLRQPPLGRRCRS